MMTNKDAEELEKMLTKLKNTGTVGTEVTVQDFKAIRGWAAGNCWVDDRGPLDLTRRIDELEAENKTLKARLDKLQKVMFDQFRNKGAL